MSASFKSLSPHAQDEFIELREHIHRIIAQQPDGVAYVLNALYAVSSETVDWDIYNWRESVRDIDPRDLNAFCHDSGRLVVAGGTGIWD